MKIKVLGSSGSELPEYNLPAFLVDDSLLIDAGTIGLTLREEEQKRISHILISHAHLDHIKALPFFVDNLAGNNIKRQVTVLSGRDVLSDLKKNIFNNRIWPDFNAIPNKKNPILKYQAIRVGILQTIKDYRVYAWKVSHSVAAYGFIVKDIKGNAFVYSGDTGPTYQLWKEMGSHDIRALFIEVSFPNHMKELALKSGHLTPSLLEIEINKMKTIPQKIFVMHVKPQYRKTIEKELKRIDTPSIEILEDKRIINI